MCVRVCIMELKNVGFEKQLLNSYGSSATLLSDLSSWFPHLQNGDRDIIMGLWGKSVV